MKKLLKMFGFGTALTTCGLAFADWWCNRCHTWHNGRKCPAITLGFVPDDHRNYGCEPYGCFHQDNYACYDDGYDSDDEEDMIRQAIQDHREHHERTIQRICNSINHVKNANDFRRVQEALRQRAWVLDLHLNQYGCIDDGYGCQNYGCIDFYNDYGCIDFYGCGY